MKNHLQTSLNDTVRDLQETIDGMTMMRYNLRKRIRQLKKGSPGPSKEKQMRL